MLKECRDTIIGIKYPPPPLPNIVVEEGGGGEKGRRSFGPSRFGGLVFFLYFYISFYTFLSPVGGSNPAGQSLTHT